MHLNSKQNDRAMGVLVGQAGGDALGVPFRRVSLTRSSGRSA